MMIDVGIKSRSKDAWDSGGLFANDKLTIANDKVFKIADHGSESIDDITIDLIENVN